MAVQLSLSGIDPSASPTERLLFALRPHPKDAELISRRAFIMREERRSREPLIKTDHLHVTQHFVGDFPELRPSLVDDLRRAAASVAIKRFEITFTYAMSFAGSGAFVLRCCPEQERVLELQPALKAALAKVGIRPKYSPDPHMTLFYDQNLTPRFEIEPISWPVNEFVLIHSRINQTRHITLGSWPLLG